MFSNLFFSTLPLFGLVFIGYSLGKFSLFNDTEAKVFTKLVGLVVLPALGIKIIGNFNYEFINWKLYFCYLLGQGIIYFIAFIIAKKVFNRSTPECIIIGLVSSSSNHLFFIYPIVLVEFAAKDIVPIETVIAADFITVGLSVCALDFTTQNKLDVKKALLKQIKNPAFIGLILGLIIYHSSINLPESANRLVDFICASGVPLTLLGMGILLSYKTDTTQIQLSFLITFLKLFGFLIVLTTIIWLSDITFTDAKTTLMLSSAPIGAMALIFASIYNVKTDAVVRSGIMTYIIALFLIPLVGSIF
jgi:predicted permease